MKFLGFIIILLILSFPFEKLLNKLFSVEKKKISETPGKRIDRWGRSIILVVSLCSLPIVVVAEPVINKVDFHLLFHCTIWFSINYGVEIPEKDKSIYSNIFLSIGRCNFVIQCGVFISNNGMKFCVGIY